MVKDGEGGMGTGTGEDNEGGKEEEVRRGGGERRRWKLKMGESGTRGAVGARHVRVAYDGAKCNKAWLCGGVGSSGGKWGRKTSHARDKWFAEKAAHSARAGAHAPNRGDTNAATAAGAMKRRWERRVESVNWLRSRLARRQKCLFF